MSALKSILLHLDASPRSAKRLALAGELAALHGAQVMALYASTPAMLSLPFIMAQGTGELLGMLQQLDADYRDGAKALFERSAAAPTQPAMHWRELRGEPVIPGVAARALCADLRVLGQHDASDPMTVGVPSDFIASVLLASGRPGLVLPYVDICASFGQEILIAWKPTRESAHAVSAALPFLQRAQHLHLTVASEGSAAAEQADDLETDLRLHGVAAPIRRCAPLRDDAAGDGLLSLAAEIGADLLVMGCFGHSRARELVLGGASRAVLQSMTLPVLMAH